MTMQHTNYSHFNPKIRTTKMSGMRKENELSVGKIALGWFSIFSSQRCKCLTFQAFSSATVVFFYMLVVPAVSDVS